MNGDVLPVSRGLIVALALGFGLFNEILFGVAGAAIVAQGRAAIGGWMLAFSVGVGAALLVVHFVFLLTAKSRQWTDLMAGAIAGGLAAWSAQRGVERGIPGAVWVLLAANLWLAAWWSRGWLRRAIVRRSRTHARNRA